MKWSPFVYISDFKGQKPNAKPVNDLSSNPVGLSIKPLATAKVGDRLRIVSMNCGEGNTRLMGMGLMPGVVLTVVGATANGSIIVAIANHRLGLAVEVAQQIEVTEVSESDGDHFLSQRTTNMENNQEVSAIKLRDVEIGANLRVVGYESTARDYKRKLLAMGLTIGTEFIVKRHAPLGDPIEIEVRGFSLSLRKAEAEVLIVERVVGVGV